MKEIRQHVIPTHYEIRLQCDSCEKGFMKYTGEDYIKGFRTFFIHKCTHCQKEDRLIKIYPDYATTWEDAPDV